MLRGSYLFPTEIKANFDLTITISDVADQVPSGYTAKLLLGGAASLTKDGAIDGSDIVFTLSASDTASFITGQYWYQIVAEDGNDSRLFIAEGSTRISAALLGTGTYDGRSVAEKILDAIDATILGKATADQQSYVIQSGSGSRSLSRIPLPELREIREEYAKIVAAERRATNDQPLLKRHTFAFVND